MRQTSMGRAARAWALRATVVIGALVAARRDFEVPSVPAVRANAVLRWEYRPGSALLLAWRVGRPDADAEGAGGGGCGGRRHRLAAGRGALTVRASWWVGL